MKVKTKGFLTGTVFAVLTVLLALVIIFVPKGETTASAATQTQSVVFNYNYHINDSQNILSENNVEKTQKIRSSDDGKKCEVSFQLNTDIVLNSDNSIWVNNVGLKSLIIRALSNFNIVGFEVKNGFGESIYLSSSNLCVVTLDEGEYIITYKGSSNWWEIVGEQKVIKSANIECVINIFVDTTPPIIESSLNSFEVDTNTSFIVMAKDVNKSKLYYKKPNMTTFLCAESALLNISENSIEGKYYFYAIDALNNRTVTHWINLKDTVIDYIMIKSDHDNSICFSWEGDALKATIDGETYEKSTWIKTEGNHTFRLFNDSGKEILYDFNINHYYESKEYIAPTCATEGKSVKLCIQCDMLYEENIPATGHQYVITSIPATCTEKEHIIFNCNICEFKIEKDGEYPTGHNYNNEIVTAPTCIEDGIRRSTCESCGHTFDTKIVANGHSYTIKETTSANGKTTRTYACTTCGYSYSQELGDQFEEVTNYIEYLFVQYAPYMWWVLLASTGIWSILIGVMIAIAQKNEDKEKARKMLINYVIGLVVIAIIVVACPFLIRGIAALVT